MSVPPRLKLLDPSLREIVNGAGERGWRQMALAVSQLASDRVGISDPRIAAAVTRLRAGEYGDSAERGDVLALTEELDEKAWDVSRRVEAGEADMTDYVKAFKQARAAHTVWYALDADPLEAAAEATYEALAATEDGDAVRRVIQESLK